LNDESSLKPPKEKEDENHYQNRPQNTTRGIAPALAVRPGRKGADEKEDEDDNYNSAQHGISPLWFVVSLTHMAALACSCPALAPGPECQERILFYAAKGLSAPPPRGPRPHQTQYAYDNQVNRHNNTQQAGLNQYQYPGD